ncbi:MAG: exosortase system-associated protein, TIGR04073 family [Methylococcales bacterium]|jgi:putative exosortase-associated protein (TIGR04073 family)|nr:exosortase system-associated protein, TIGR04073 family [Methylococcales bacterium]
MKQSLKTLLVVFTLCLLTPHMASATPDTVSTTPYPDSTTSYPNKMGGTSQEMAGTSTYPDRMGIKLGNSMANMLTGIGEIPKGIINGNRKHGATYAATAGLMTGMVHMMGRTLCGAADLVTFMIPTKPMISPEFVWQNFKKDTGYKSTWELLP